MKFLTIVALIALVGMVLAAPGGDKNGQRKHKTDKKWQAYKNKHHHVRKYQSDAEEEKGFRNFLKTDELIEKVNKDFEAGKSTYKMEHNQMSAMSPEEKAQMNGLVKPKDATNRNKRSSRTVRPSCSGINVPPSYDWTVEGEWKPALRDQGQCTSCWAFAAAAAMEGQYWKQNKQVLDLAPQQLLDCVKPDGQGCVHGGWYGNAFDWTAANQGATLEPYYPYKEKQERCQVVSADRQFVNLTNTYDSLSLNSFDDLKCAIISRGPLAAALEGSNELMSFRGGLFQFPRVNTISHAVLIIGYGVDARTGKEYVRIKNSWPTWGETGGYGNIAFRALDGNVIKSFLTDNEVPNLAPSTIGGTRVTTIATTTTRFAGECRDVSIYGSTFCAEYANECGNKIVVNNKPAEKISNLCPITCKIPSCSDSVNVATTAATFRPAVLTTKLVNPITNAVITTKPALVTTTVFAGGNCQDAQPYCSQLASACGKYNTQLNRPNGKMDLVENVCPATCRTPCTPTIAALTTTTKAGRCGSDSNAGRLFCSSVSYLCGQGQQIQAIINGAQSIYKVDEHCRGTCPCRS